MSDKHQNVFFFQCEKDLKEEFHQICIAKGANPHSLLRAFMRKVIKEYKDKQEIQEKLAQQQSNQTNNLTNLQNQSKTTHKQIVLEKLSANSNIKNKDVKKLSLSEEFKQDIEEQDYIDGLSEDMTKSDDNKH